MLNQMILGLNFSVQGKDKGGVAPEPWHLSYKPMVDIYIKK